MLFRALDLVRGQKVVTLPLGTSFHTAVDIMTKRDFSQIPITDRDGIYLGLLSEHGVVKHLHKVSYEQSALNDTIDRWYDHVEAAYLDIDVGQVLTKLKTQGAVVIVDVQRRPVAVVTYDDAAAFYGTYAYGFMLLEYIERTLRRYIEAVYPDPTTRNAMMAKAPTTEGAGANTGDRRPERYEDFTLQNNVDAIMSRRCWNAFAPYFGVKKSFESAFRGISIIRNDAMHFHSDRLDEVQIQALEYTARYLDHCERQYPPSPDVAAANYKVPVDEPPPPDLGDPDIEYSALAQWLHVHSSQSGNSKPISLRFADIEAALGKPLPLAAYKYEDWWRNSWFDSPVFEWSGMTWTAVHVDLKHRFVVFSPDSPPPPDSW